MDERDRFEALLALLDRLVEANRAAPIIVEGQRDVAALRALGIVGDIECLHGGQRLFTLAEDLARRTDTVILLPDWDRKGVRLATHLEQACTANGVRADLTFWSRINAAVDGQLKDVESLAPFVHRRFARFHRAALEDRGRGHSVA